MRIGINAILVHASRSGGAETYARNLIRWLPEIDRRNEYFIVTGQDSGLEVSAPNCHHIECRLPATHHYRRVLWEQMQLPQVLRHYKLDLVHFPGSTAPFLFSGPGIVTIHETLRYQVPHLTPWLLGAYYGWNQRRIAARGDFVIAVSHADARVMVDRLGLNPERVAVVPLGVGDDFHASRASADAQPRREYALWVGNFYAHKNVEVLFDAYAMLLGRRVEPPLLRMIGATDRDRRRLLPVLQRKGLAQRVVLEDRLPHDMLPRIYREAQILCFPSKYESFGLPLVEAMASGTAVVCSDLPAFREVCGGAAIYCSPDSPEEFADGIQRVMFEVGCRRSLEDCGAARARQFTWKKCAAQTVAVYERFA